MVDAYYGKIKDKYYFLIISEAYRLLEFFFSGIHFAQFSILISFVILDFSWRMKYFLLDGKDGKR